MLKFIFILFLNSELWNTNFCVELNVVSRVIGDGQIKYHDITADGNYEITIGGGSGGGHIRISGGRGGLISGVSQFKTNDKISVVIGGNGQSVGTNDCVTPGGGGATIVFVKKSQGASVYPELILIAPGGGGGGHGQLPNNPDYKELTNAISGPCNTTSNMAYQAAKGRSYATDSLLHKSIFTYQTNPNANLTHGCLGGYGGGGQGGSLVNDYNDIGGGGGGGAGHVGGETSDEKGFFGTCTAGGPGKPLCLMDICGVATVNNLYNSHFSIKLHKPYEELSLKPRTNTERPNQEQNMALNCIIVKVSILSVMIPAMITSLLLN